MLLTPEETEQLLTVLKDRFMKNMYRHKDLEWVDIEVKLEVNPEKLWSLGEMERTGGEPDVIGQINMADGILFFDCSAESPQGRRSLCYDREALNSRKDNKPASSVMDTAAAMGIELLTEETYRYLQGHEIFDTKTSSWIKTPPDIRKLGGAIFADYRYGHVFVYHNSAGSYYASRGFRGLLRF